MGVSFKYLPGDLDHRVPVLIKIDPNLLLDQTGSNSSTAQELIAQSVQKGLRASLKSGSLLTGQLFVDLDFQKDAPPASVASLGDYQVLPTVPAAGLDELQGKVEALLDKFKALPLEKTVSTANDALAAVKEAAANLEKLTGPEGSLSKTLNNAEKITAELSGNKDIGGTLHYSQGNLGAAEHDRRRTQRPVQKNRGKPHRGERHGKTPAVAIGLAFHQKI